MDENTYLSPKHFNVVFIRLLATINDNVKKKNGFCMMVMKKVYLKPYTSGGATTNSSDIITEHLMIKLSATHS